MFSPRPQQHQQAAWVDQFAQERQKLQREIGEQLRRNMASIIGHQPTADLLLVSADGRKMPAHLCILKRRAPSFFQRYVQATLDAMTPRNAYRQERQLLEIAVGDVDSGALEFFVRSIYTDEEVYGLDWVPEEEVDQSAGGHDGDESGPSGNMGGRGGADFFDDAQIRSKTSEGAAGKSEGDAKGGIERRNNSQLMSASFPSPEEASGLISFRELAENSASNSIQHLSSNVDDGQGQEETSKTCSGELIPKFMGIETKRKTSSNTLAEDGERPKSLSNKNASIFPYFVNIGGNEEEGENAAAMMTRSLPCAPADERSAAGGSESPFGSGIELVTSIRSRALAARRLSASSANSLTSIDLLTPTQEMPPFRFDDQMRAASKLGADLAQIFAEDHAMADVRVVAADGEELAHSCILWASGSDFFKQQLASLKFAPSPGRRAKIELRRFSRTSLHFLLQFLYGGLTCVPADQVDCGNSLDPWELIELGAYIKLDMFIRVVLLHIRAMFAHFFHRPCAACVSAMFEILPKMELEIPAVKQLFEEAMQWQAAHFTRIWKGRVFLHLSEPWQKQCRDALLQSIDEESVVDVLLGCEKLQMTLPRIKLHILAQKVAKMVNDVEEYCAEFLANSLDSLIQSKAFSSFGHGLALNLTLLEDILPPITHSLSAETTIRSFLALKELLAQIECRPTIGRESGASSCTNSPLKKKQQSRSSLYGSNQSIISAGWREQLLLDEWNPRFKCLCHRLLDLLDRHMLHYANSILNSPEWNLLNSDEQSRIKENGLFVEMRMPRMAPPRLSSAGRSYKRSSSVGLGHGGGHGMGGSGERTRSLERNSSLGFGAGPRPPFLSTQLEEEIVASESPVMRENAGEEEPTDFAGVVPGMLKIGSDEKVGGGPALGPTKIPAKISAGSQKKGGGKVVDVGKKQQKEEENDAERREKMKKKMEEEGDEGENGKKKKKEGGGGTESANNKKGKKMKEKNADGMDEAKKKPEEAEERKKIMMEEEAENKIKRAKMEKENVPSIEKARKKAKEEEAGKEIVAAIDDPMMPSTSATAQTEEANIVQPHKPPPPSSALNERQRTHTVMTVDQNLRAGINAYLENKIKNGSKPQSIVRPMPKVVAASVPTTENAAAQSAGRRESGGKNGVGQQEATRKAPAGASRNAPKGPRSRLQRPANVKK